MNTPAVTNIKLINFTNSNASSTSNLQNNNPQTKNTQNDSWNFSINKKKSIKFAGFAAAAIAVAAGIFYSLRKKPPVEAKEMIKQANEFAKNFKEKFQSTIDETITLYKNGGKDSNGNIIAKITEDAGFPSRKIMEEFTNGCDIPSKTSIFIDDKLGLIEKLTENNKYDIVVLNQEGKISNCQEGFEKFDNGNFNIAKEAYLDNDKPYLYTEEFHFINNRSKGGEWTIEKEVGISEKNKPIHYREKVKMDGTGEYKAKLWKTFIDHKWHNLAKGKHKI